MFLKSTLSPLFALGIKVVGVAAIAAILFSTNLALGTTLEENQEATPDGGLTASLDAPSYTKGDRVTVSGSVEDSNEGSTVWINVEDPLGKQVEGYIVDVNMDGNTFSQSWTAGIQEHNPITEPTYDREGVYRVTVSYLTPDFQNEEVILTFDYSNTPLAPPATPPASTPPIQETPPPMTTPSFPNTADEDSFRVQIPEGWVMRDVNNIGPELLQESTQGYSVLARLCPQEEAALPRFSDGGTDNNCEGAHNVIHILRYPDLETRLGTAGNIMSYHLQKLQEVGYRGMQIISSADTTVNLTNSLTNETMATVPANLVEMTYNTASAPAETRSGYFLLTASAATLPSPGTPKGYSIFYEGDSVGEVAAPSGGLAPLPLAVAQIFDSFELIAAPEIAQAIGATAPQQQPVQQQDDSSSIIRSFFSDIYDGFFDNPENNQVLADADVSLDPNNPNAEEDEDNERPDYNLLASVFAASKPTTGEQVQAAIANQDIDVNVIREMAKESLGDLVFLRAYMALGDIDAAMFHLEKISRQMLDIQMEVGFTRPPEQMVIIASETADDEEEEESNSGKIISELEQREQQAIAEGSLSPPNSAAYTTFNANEINQLTRDVEMGLGSIIATNRLGNTAETTSVAQQLGEALLQIYYKTSLDNFAVPVEQVQIVGSTAPFIQELRQ